MSATVTKVGAFASCLVLSAALSGGTSQFSLGGDSAEEDAPGPAAQSTGQRDSVELLRLRQVHATPVVILGPAAALGAAVVAAAALSCHAVRRGPHCEQEGRQESLEVGPGECSAVAWVCACVAFNEGFAATAIFAFCAKMTEELRGSPLAIGYYSGLLYTANYTGMLLMAYPWARFSDKVGRRPCLLVSTLSCMICNLLIALTENYWSMVVLRLICGLLNANNSFSKTSLREAFYRNNLDDTPAFSYVSTSYAVSSLLGPSLGGLLYGQVLSVTLPWQASWTLPWFLVAGLNFGCFLVVVCLQPETFFDMGVAEPRSETYLFKDRRFIMVLFMAWAHSYVFTGWETIYPTFAELPASSLGEGWSTARVGVTFLVGGVALGVYNILVFSWMVSNFTVVRLWIWPWVLPLMPLAVFPRLVMYSVAQQHVDSSAVLVALLNYGSQVVLSVCLGSGFTSIQLIANAYVASLPDGRSQLASANGGLASVQALARAARLHPSRGGYSQLAFRLLPSRRPRPLTIWPYWGRARA